MLPNVSMSPFHPVPFKIVDSTVKILNMPWRRFINGKKLPKMPRLQVGDFGFSGRSIPHEFMKHAHDRLVI